ncbi:hypothetical protein HDF12_002342 [Edaphobacter lichenicola]|uniref:Uncharacterized protein n=1 Tax=Tunturiibacter lichenicola TaxID=2051959 RepID=A0A7Y9NMM1_9BACT|nr:hypothetical protein [Edaphobacter lichenicola]
MQLQLPLPLPCLCICRCLLFAVILNGVKDPDTFHPMHTVRTFQPKHSNVAALPSKILISTPVHHLIVNSPQTNHQFAVKPKNNYPIQNQ